MVTAAHCVELQRVNDTVQVEVLADVYDGIVVCKHPITGTNWHTWPFEFPDIAVIDLGRDIGAPLVCREENPTATDIIWAYGYPLDLSEGGESRRLTFSGPTFLDKKRTKERYLFGGDQIHHGLSGGPIFNETSNAVIGVLTISANVSRPEGGMATPTRYVFDHCEFLASIAVDRVTLEVPLTAQDIDAIAATIAIDTSTKRTVTSNGRAAPSTQTIPSVRDAKIDLDAMPRPSFDEVLRITQKYRALGLGRSAFNVIGRLIEGDDFHRASPSQQARAHRARATLALEYFDDLDDAVTSATLASQLDDSADQRILQAAIAVRAGGIEAALAQLSGSEDDIVLARAGYYVVDAQLERAREEFGKLDTVFQASSSKAQRLLADTALMSTDGEAARAHSRRAYELDPENLWVRLSAIRVLVSSAIPDSLLLQKWTEWPQPLPQKMILSSAAVRENLDLALALCIDILTYCELDEHSRSIIEIWRLAALTYNESRREEATQYAKILVDATPPNHRAIPWIGAANFDVDLTQPILRLREMIARSEAAPEIVLAVVSELLSRHEGNAAQKLLLEQESIFAPLFVQQWAYFMVEAYLDMGQYQAAYDMLDYFKAEEDNKQVRRVIELAEAGQDGQAIPQETQLRSSETVLGQLELAESAARNADWETIADGASALLAALPTAYVARLVVLGAYNAGRYDLVLALYDSFVQLTNGIPDEVERARGFALERIGDPRSDAVLSALVSRSPSDENVIALGHIYAMRGDYSSLDLLARNYHEHAGVRLLIALASWVRIRNSELARQMLERALTLEIPGDLLGAALALATHLGLEDKLQGTMQRAPEQLALGGIHVLSQVDAIHVIRESSRRATDLGKRYVRGEIPIHFLYEPTNTDVVRSHREFVLENADTAATAWTPIYIRHGSRQWLPRPTLPSGIPLVDCTSLILADTLGVLSNLVEFFPHIAVPQNLPRIIAAAAERRSRLQPRRIKSIETILHGIEQSELSIAPSGDIYDIATRESAFIIDFLPPRDQETGEVIPGSIRQQENGITLVCVTNSLLKTGAIDAETHAAVVRRMGSLLNVKWPNDDRVLTPGSELIARENTIEVLEEAGILAVTASVYKLLVDPRWLDRVKRELGDRDEQDKLRAYLLDGLLERVNLWLREGRLRPMPLHGGNEGETSPEAASLFCLTQAALSENDFIVCDDRFATAATSREDGRRILTLFELLDAMREIGRLNAETYYEALLVARRGGLFYLPLTAEEILRHLARASSENGVVRETAALRTLRRYVARAVYDREALAPENAQGPALVRQVPFTFSVVNAVREAIARLLLVDGSADAVAKADWLAQNVTIDGLPGFGLSSFLHGSGDSEVAVDVELAAHLTRLAMA